MDIERQCCDYKGRATARAARSRGHPTALWLYNPLMDVVLLLADAAQGSNNNAKIHALGLGWDVTSAPTPPSAVVAMIKVPWDETNEKHHLTLQLRDADGRPVTLSTPTGEQPVHVEADFEVGRPPGIPPGTMQMMKLPISVGPMPIAPGRYEWHAQIDGTSQENWVAGFTARPGGAPQ